MADAVALSARLLRAARTGEPTGDLRAELSGLPEDDLAASLGDDAARIAFWLNVYNTSVLATLADEPERYRSKRRFFGAERIGVAGRQLSLDDVEHGMLRGSRSKWGLGYLPRLFPGEFERRFRVRDPDPRVHFALNCGAASCPPIAAYSADGIDGELDAATAAYLDSEAAYEPDAGIVRVPRQFLWFRGDFGSRSGILSLLRDHGVIPEGASPRLKHRSYDWSLDAELPGVVEP